jgi:hypothetical protein
MVQLCAAFGLPRGRLCRLAFCPFKFDHGRFKLSWALADRVHTVLGNGRVMIACCKGWPFATVAAILLLYLTRCLRTALMHCCAAGAYKGCMLAAGLRKIHCIHDLSTTSSSRAVHCTSTMKVALAHWTI